MRYVIPIYRSPVLILVSSGDKPGTSPRRLKMWNFTSKEVIRELGFQSTVVVCVINRTFLVVGTEDSVQIYNVSDMSLLHKMNAVASSGSVIALSQEPASHLAYCVTETAGQNRGHNTDATQVGEVAILDCNQLRVISRIPAHKTAVAVLAFSASGLLLATASVTGSLVRVFSVPGGDCLHELRHSLPGSLHVLSMFSSGPGPDHVQHSRGGDGAGTSVGGLSGAITALSFCPKEQYLLTVSANAAGQRGGFLNIFRLGRSSESSSTTTRGRRCDSTEQAVGPDVDRRSSEGADGAAGEGEDSFVSVEPDEVPPPPEPDTSLRGWGLRLAESAVQGVRTLQLLTKEYATAAASAAGMRERLAPGQAPVLYARIHSNAEGAGGAAGHGSAATEGLREGVNFFAWLNHSASGAKLALCVVSCQSGLFHRCVFPCQVFPVCVLTSLMLPLYNRYNLGFLQESAAGDQDGKSEGTVSLSDTRPPSAAEDREERGGNSSEEGRCCDGAAAGPRTLSELMEEECLLLDLCS
jgi:hypothetical protein